MTRSCILEISLRLGGTIRKGEESPPEQVQKQKERLDELADYLEQLFFLSGSGEFIYAGPGFAVYVKKT
jgi:hypothetical protein